ncbi:MAG: hypothetical protein SPI12_01265 [Actinomycetaceae bacterium]|nr:hypothetical protein [Actinomycetaceae bacterium]MDY6082476.1 hypothetical protein [Actinomycetaceae bacterium]
MADWKPIRGHLHLWDTTLTDMEKTASWFADQRILARYRTADESESSLTVQIEVAVTGLRKHLAVMGDDGEVSEGMTLGEFMNALKRDLNKVRVEFAGDAVESTYGFGEVDVADDIDASLQAPTSLEAPTEILGSSEDSSEDEDEVSDDDRPPALPSMLISPMTMAQAPGLAASLKVPVTIVKLKNARAAIAKAYLDKPTGASWGVTLTLHAGEGSQPAPDPHDAREAKPVAQDADVYPRLHAEGRELPDWEWDDDFRAASWVDTDAAATQFVEDTFGAQAWAHYLADKLDVDAQALSDALTAPRKDGSAALIAVLGLDPFIEDALLGHFPMAEIEHSHTFLPENLADRTRRSVAYEVSGEGRAYPGFWAAYRTVVLAHPRILIGVGALEVGVGALLGWAGIRRWSRSGTQAKMMVAIGSALAVDALTNNLTATWVRKAIEAEGIGHTGTDHTGTHRARATYDTAAYDRASAPHSKATHRAKAAQRGKARDKAARAGAPTQSTAHATTPWFNPLSRLTRPRAF